MAGTVRGGFWTKHTSLSLSRARVLRPVKLHATDQLISDAFARARRGQGEPNLTMRVAHNLNRPSRRAKGLCPRLSIANPISLNFARDERRQLGISCTLRALCSSARGARTRVVRRLFLRLPFPRVTHSGTKLSSLRKGCEAKHCGGIDSTRFLCIFRFGFDFFFVLGYLTCH